MASQTGATSKFHSQHADCVLNAFVLKVLVGKERGLDRSNHCFRVRTRTYNRRRLHYRAFGGFHFDGSALMYAHSRALRPLGSVFEGCMTWKGTGFRNCFCSKAHSFPIVGPFLPLSAGLRLSLLTVNSFALLKVRRTVTTTGSSSSSSWAATASAAVTAPS
mgnify:CR=1 FL=1